jgi:hypothetical protein
MLAYVFWHRSAAGVETAAYEQALERFHRSLAHSPPSGFRGSSTLRAAELPWLAGPDGTREGGAGGYEDWYLVDSWESLGVLEGAAVSRGHVTAHEQAARRAGAGAGGVYRLLDGAAVPAQARLSVWVSRAPGRPDPALADLLEDGMERERSSLWRRCMVLGPAPEFCLLSVGETLEPETGVAPRRLPAGWTAHVSARAAIGA